MLLNWTVSSLPVAHKLQSTLQLRGKGERGKGDRYRETSGDQNKMGRQRAKAERGEQRR